MDRHEPENCDTTLVSNRRGNGIHQWNCEGNLIRGNEISDTRDGIYFSFTNKSHVENNHVHHVRYGLHYMYSDENVFENNTFTENAAGAAIMFSKDLGVRGNRFVNNRGHRAYGMIFQSSDRSMLEGNEIQRKCRWTFLQPMQRQPDGRAIASPKITSACVSVRTRTTIDSPKTFLPKICTQWRRADRSFRQALGRQRGRQFLGRTRSRSIRPATASTTCRIASWICLGVLRREFPAIAFLRKARAETIALRARTGRTARSELDRGSVSLNSLLENRAQRTMRPLLPRIMITPNISQRVTGAPGAAGMSSCRGKRDHTAGRAQRCGKTHHNENLAGSSGPRTASLDPATSVATESPRSGYSPICRKARISTRG